MFYNFLCREIDTMSGDLIKARSLDLFYSVGVAYIINDKLSRHPNVPSL